MHIRPRNSTISGESKNMLFWLLVGMCLFGLVILASASAVYAQEHFGDSFFFVKRQILFGILPGALLLYIAFRLPVSFFEKNTGIWYGILLLLLGIVLIPGIGYEFGTFARSWIAVGSLRFQPAEVGKVLYIAFLAGYLCKKGSKLKSFEEGFLPTLIVAAVPCLLLVLQPDVGTAMIYGGILLSMLVVAQAKHSHVFLLLCAGIAISAVLIGTSPYRTARLTTFLHPELDPLGTGYHVNQAMLAVGSGGVFGLGLGHSRQKFAYLPEVQADSIFAILAEELGFILSIIFLAVFVWFCVRVMREGLAFGDTWGVFFCVGVGTWWFLQASVNIGAMLGLMPLTGVPLPFVSHGGTALMAELAAMGIVFRIIRV